MKAASAELQSHLKHINLRLDDILPLSAKEESSPADTAHPVMYDSNVVISSPPCLLQNIKLEDLMLDIDIPFCKFLCQ
jgi:hypothetical protein